MYQIEKLKKEDLNKWLDFFDNRAFKDNPYWKSCYCTFFHQPELKDTKSNRELAIDLINKEILQGYIVLNEDKKIVGWCNVNEKRNYSKLNEKSKDLSDDSIISIVCFIIEKEHRKKGLTHLLISRIIEDAKKNGKKIIEAYPATKATTDSGNYKGNISTYKKFGFIEEKVGRKIIMKLILNN